MQPEEWLDGTRSRVVELKVRQVGVDVVVDVIEPVAAHPLPRRGGFTAPAGSGRGCAKVIMVWARAVG